MSINPELIEAITPHQESVQENGELEYLETYRLSASRTKQVYLLSQLAAHEWNLAETAATLNNTLDELVKRLEKVGFGYLINQQVREQVATRMKS